MTDAFNHEPRKALSPQKRAKLFLDRGGKCHRCERKLGPADKWIVEHLIALENGGSNDQENLCITCDWCKPGKDAEDHGRAAKGRRRATKHVVPTRDRQRRGFRAWRRFDGTIVRKE